MSLHTVVDEPRDVSSEPNGTAVQPPPEKKTRYFGGHAYPVTRETRWRHRFLLLTLVVTVVLISWGGFVTSIDAGLAVPDWPATFGSYDPFATGYEDPTDPTARWWHSTPVLAEHGHRLLGALVGLLMIVLAGWTWWADPRRWMRGLGLLALGLVIVQGVLGGLRVVWLSLDLAVVHACTAQLFFALLVAMTLFTSRAWLEGREIPRETPVTRRLRGLSLATVLVLYVQIILGALLRHWGGGLNLTFAAIHITGAFVVVGLVFATFAYTWKHFGPYRLLVRAVWFLLGAVGLQFALGLAAYLVMLHEASLALRSVLQVTLNSAHLVVGALLMAATVCVALLAFRRAPEAGDGLAHREPAMLHPSSLTA